MHDCFILKIIQCLYLITKFNFRYIFNFWPGFKTVSKFVLKNVEFCYAPFDIKKVKMKSLHPVHLPNRPRKSLGWSLVFERSQKFCENLRLVCVFCNGKWLKILHNLRFSDSSIIDTVSITQTTFLLEDFESSKFLSLIGEDTIIFYDS